MSLEKIKETTKEAERLINQGLRNGKTFDEIKDLQATHKMVQEEIRKHPELQKDSDAALKLITDSVVKRFSGPWGRLLLGRKNS